MDKIQIEHGIEIPHRSRNQKYPYKYMNVGDSFFVANRADLHSTAAYATKTLSPKVFRAIKVKGGMRVWRIN